MSDCSPHIANIGRLVEVSGHLLGSFPPASSRAVPVSGPRLVSLRLLTRSRAGLSARGPSSAVPQTRAPRGLSAGTPQPCPPYRVWVGDTSYPSAPPVPTPSGRRGALQLSPSPQEGMGGRPGPGRGLPHPPVWPPRGLQIAGGAGAS